MLTLDHISCTINGSQLINEITVTINKGEIIGLIGPPESGKTILLQIISGRMPEQKGTVIFNDMKIGQRARRKYISGIGTGKIQNMEISLFDYLMLARLPHKKIFRNYSQIDIQTVEIYMDLFDLMNKQTEALYTLSASTLKRAHIAFNLIRELPVLCLDNPTAMLDIKSIILLRNAVQRYTLDGQRSVVLASNDLNFISQTCDRILLLNKGGIVLEGDANLITAPLIKKYFKAPVMISKNIYNGKPEIHVFPDN